MTASRASSTEPSSSSTKTTNNASTAAAAAAANAANATAALAPHEETFFPDHKLRVRRRVHDPSPPSTSTRRCYTLTHNDLTGSLALSIDETPDKAQMKSLGSALLRDAVWGEWRHHVTATPTRAETCENLPLPPHPPTPSRVGSARGMTALAMSATAIPTSITSETSLHLHCTVADSAAWWLPPAVLATLRRWIFAKELPLVLEAIALAEGGMLAEHPHLGTCPIYVHFRHGTADEGASRVEYYGTLDGRRQLGDIVPSWQSSWRHGGVEYGWDNEVLLSDGSAAAAARVAAAAAAGHLVETSKNVITTNIEEQDAEMAHSEM